MILKFKENHNKRTQAVGFFENGYGYSIVKNYIYGDKEYFLVELAVINGNENSFTLNYNTPIANDTVRGLTLVEAIDLIDKIRKPPK
jgi:hypothetical protein